MKKRESKQEGKKVEKDAGVSTLKQGTLFFSTKVQKPVLQEVVQETVFPPNAILADEAEQAAAQDAIAVVEKKRGRKPKDQTIPAKDASPVEVHEKVREWKDRREQYAAILKDLLSKGHAEARENIKKCPLQHNLNLVGDSMAILEDGLKQIHKEIVRISQEMQNPANENTAQTPLIYTNLSDSLKNALLTVLGPIIDSSPLNLEKLASSCYNFLNERLSPSISAQDQPIFAQVLKLLTDFVSQCAERKSYGIKSKDAILYIDESADALWHWELFNFSFLPASLQQDIVFIRSQRATLFSKAKSLAKLLTLIDKAASYENDLPRIIEEYEKYNKIVRKENAQMQQQAQKEAQQREKERIEREKAEARDKERADKYAKELEKERERQAKEAEKAAKEEAKERERQAKEQERLKKEELVKQERETREREKKEKEEAKERERIAKEQEKERERQMKEEEKAKKEAERLEKKRAEEEEKQRLEEEKKVRELADKAAQEAKQRQGSLFNFLISKWIFSIWNYQI
ncbi:hypothetical protein FGO68_gene12227 [Halteria grandinella]|uniref:Uncharacterized protein n=1 Tax=Halteria grandinella TaxID=5974 RepID=A0A8J8SUI7_HALGN|nr:hypothetical protein FGO68_gene12227 [Halteria grandinella]